MTNAILGWNKGKPPYGNQVKQTKKTY